MEFLGYDDNRSCRGLSGIQDRKDRPGTFRIGENCLFRNPPLYQSRLHFFRFVVPPVVRAAADDQGFHFSRLIQEGSGFQSVFEVPVGSSVFQMSSRSQDKPGGGLSQGACGVVAEPPGGP